jgi:hypothetical protein
MSAERFYAVRQARTKVVGSRPMSRREADRETAVWRERIGPAAVVPVNPTTRRAVLSEDQATLAAYLTAGQARA